MLVPLYIKVQTIGPHLLLSIWGVPVSPVDLKKMAISCVCAGTVVCPNTTYIAYRQGREMHTLVQLDVEYYNLGYNHP